MKMSELNTDMPGDATRRPSLAAVVLDATTSVEGAAAVIEVGDAALERAIDADLIDDVPLLGVLSKMAKVGLGIRERLFLRKLAGFLRGVGDLGLDEREAFARRIDEDEEFERRVGAGLVLVLERADDLKKPELLGRAFAAFLRNELTEDQFRRMSAAIDRVYLGDVAFLASHRVGRMPEEEPVFALAAAGLVSVISESGFGQGGVRYEVSTVGGLLLTHCIDGTRSGAG